MRYAMIMAGGAGTRLWPMSRAEQPKQLIPFIDGKSLLELAFDRLDGLVPKERQYICAGASHREPILRALPDLDESRYLAEPTGRDTLNAVGYPAAVLAERDPDAVIAVFTADHLIQPVEKFQQAVDQGYAIAEQRENALVTFGITPTHAATGFGYLELGKGLGDGGAGGQGDGGEAHIVDEFKEKPPADVAQEYFVAGPSKYLWNSGMFVWKAKTLLACIEKYKPQTRAALSRIADAWDEDTQRDAVLNDVYPNLEKISIDFAVMEPASRDKDFQVVAVPMPLTWLDVGSWPAFAKTRTPDAQGNTTAGGKHLGLDTRNTLIASTDADHLIATIGCDDLIVIHTADATLVCHRDKAQQIKEMYEKVKETFGEKYV